MYILTVACHLVLHHLTAGFAPIYFFRRVFKEFTKDLQNLSKLFIIVVHKFSFLQFLHFFDFLSQKPHSNNKGG
ncbi:hypothetical protein CEV08_04065 [Bartonella tribocorum]|uniref:Uncharacterized protein n=1 Tax=Bartonella tribocorum TaxID=85701 RepID=A0A2M6UW59_9HYPH|nr:hypothetical protein CEV08_04065 [Bartonella tribocorum]